MTTKAPPTRTRFRSDWDEIEYLYHKILYWFYERADRERALRFAGRLRRLLERNAHEHQSIFGEECWSILSELGGDITAAVRHRERETELILKLWEVTPSDPDRSPAIDPYEVADLADRLDLLAMLYHDAGDLDHAILTLLRSKWLCASFGIPFESEGLLKDYIDENIVNSSLMSVLRKQGWGPSRPSHESHPGRGDLPRRYRPARRRRASSG
jgi:hypothetical protein